MRISTLLPTLLAFAIARTTSAQEDEAFYPSESVSVYLQPITTTSSSSPEQQAPALLAEIHYTHPTPGGGGIPPEVASYESPDIPADAKLLRVGVYDPAAREWTSATSVISVENFGKGYAPNFVVSVGETSGGKEKVLGVSLRGVRIDAGQTRNFGPQAVVVSTARGAQPELNRPVVLSPGGRKVAEEVEKTFFQKYWWVLAIGAFVMMSGGGGDGK